MLQIFSLLGLHCEENIDDCAIDSCQHGGKCKDGNNTFTCTCSKGMMVQDVKSMFYVRPVKNYAKTVVNVQT